MTGDRRLPLISATGSLRHGPQGRHGRQPAAGPVAARTGRQQRRHPRRDRPISIWPCAASLFAAVGTAGQRCTTLRRLIVHESIAETFLARLVKAYGSVKIGEPVGRRRPDGAADQRAGRGGHAATPSKRSQRAGGRDRLRRPAARSAGLLRRADDRPRPARHADRPRGDLRPDPVRDDLPDARRSDRDPQQRRSGALVGDLHRPAAPRPRRFSRRAAATAASPT